jgi:predicted lipoprotein with Yx(FWY)xxD motif
MFNAKILMTAVAAAALLTACAMGAGQPEHKVADTSLGKVLTTKDGMTLYTFANDKEPGKSACNGPCATNWPPLMAKADATPVGKWTVITRNDGAKQWAYDGMPLYAWIRDQKAGDTTGEGFNNVWKVARP